MFPVFYILRLIPAFINQRIKQATVRPERTCDVKADSVVSEEGLFVCM